jgi:hypothetical protein
MLYTPATPSTPTLFVVIGVIEVTGRRNNDTHKDYISIHLLTASSDNASTFNQNYAIRRLNLAPVGQLPVAWYDTILTPPIEFIGNPHT